jgi:hypothetical protein
LSSPSAPVCSRWTSSSSSSQKTAGLVDPQSAVACARTVSHAHTRKFGTLTARHYPEGGLAKPAFTVHVAPRRSGVLVRLGHGCHMQDLIGRQIRAAGPVRGHRGAAYESASVRIEPSKALAESGGSIMTRVSGSPVRPRRARAVQPRWFDKELRPGDGEPAGRSWPPSSRSATASPRSLAPDRTRLALVTTGGVRFPRHLKMVGISADLPNGSNGSRPAGRGRRWAGLVLQPVDPGPIADGHRHSIHSRQTKRHLDDVGQGAIVAPTRIDCLNCRGHPIPRGMLRQGKRVMISLTSQSSDGHAF